jgi:hypothetical protein
LNGYKYIPLQMITRLGGQMGDAQGDKDIEAKEMS